MLKHTKKFAFILVLFTQSAALADMGKAFKKDYLSKEDLKDLGAEIIFNKRDDEKNPVAYVSLKGGCSNFIQLRKDKEGNLIAGLLSSASEDCSEQEGTKSKTVKISPEQKPLSLYLLAEDRDCLDSDEPQKCDPLKVLIEKWETIASKNKKISDQKLKLQCEEIKIKLEGESVCATCSIEKQFEDLNLTDAKKEECSSVGIVLNTSDRRSALEKIKEKLACENPLKELEKSDFISLEEHFKSAKEKYSPEGSCKDSLKLAAAKDLLNFRIANERPHSKDELLKFIDLVNATKEDTGIQKADIYVLLANDESYWKKSLDPKLSQSIQEGLTQSLNLKYLECQKNPSEFCSAQLAEISQTATKRFEGLNQQQSLVQNTLQKQNETIWKCQTGKMSAAECASEYQKMQSAGRKDLNQIPGMSRYSLFQTDTASVINPGLSYKINSPTVESPSLINTGSGMMNVNSNASSNQSQYYQLQTALPTSYVETATLMGPKN